MGDQQIEDFDIDNVDLENFSAEDIKKAKQRLLDLLEKNNLAEDAKENLRALLGAKKPFLGDVDSFTGTLLALGLATVLFSVIFFFGYKLYKSIKEKEVKREEKKKAKQMKKKK